MARLQIAFISDIIPGGKPEINVTPVDIQVSNQLAALLEAEILAQDLHDSEPLDGEFDVAFKTRISVPIIGGVNVAGKTTIRIKR